MLERCPICGAKISHLNSKMCKNFHDLSKYENDEKSQIIILQNGIVYEIV